MIAVTGAGGMVGKGVIEELISHDYRVKALVHHKKDDFPVEQIELDIKEYKDVDQALEGCQAVIHLAAIPGPKQGKELLVFDTNVRGTYNILLAAGKNGIKRVAVASSDCTLGFTFSQKKPLPEYLPVDEEHPYHPDDSYGLSKVLTEEIGFALAKRYDMQIASLRITHVVEPDYYQTNKFKKWTGEPEATPWNLWSYIDLRDAARAFRLAIEKQFIGHQVFFIAAADTRSQIPSKELIATYFPDAKLEKEFTGYESLENTTKARKILGFRPKYSWRKGRILDE